MSSALHSIVGSLSGCILVCALAVVAGAQSAEKIVMKLGHALAADNHYQLTALEFAKAETSGRIAIQIGPLSQLRGEVQMMQELRA
ncbi:hypothetical protein [Bradyrhizobium archetypum]|uniref:C4-dicarboxylate ABC transporter substrate-binding protein n=1 Tax=Bradyrhizobium archetypum TaxID=2721160 RepID=A0A7Y4H705_9BRAD|nr:hypothetical protein [Bradyrhizobium archetypum]NOJ48563.1 hypothetical protein [Bradyrhizobium archetypum]